MTASTVFCPERSKDTPCAPCATARLRLALWKESVELPVENVSRCNDGDGGVSSEREVSATSIGEVDAGDQATGRVVRTLELAVDEVDPEEIGLIRVKVENGSVVVELHSHGDEPIAESETSSS